MIVPRPAVISAILALNLASSGCATTQPFQEQVTIYKSVDNAHSISFGLNVVKIDGNSSAQENCSDDKFNCVKSDIGLYASFPKQCPEGDWLYPSNGMKWISSFPHSHGGIYTNIPEGAFHYIWDAKYGLVGIELVADQGRGASTPAFYVSGPRILKCE